MKKIISLTSTENNIAHTYFNYKNDALFIYQIYFSCERDSIDRLLRKWKGMYVYERHIHIKITTLNSILKEIKQ